jgi:indole-3-glycerol phosphate synthase
MPLSLAEIVAATRQKLREARASIDVRKLEAAAGQHVPRGFRRALESTASTGLAIIAELKKASPSRGLIRADFDVADLARELEAAGATALSVLTDAQFFQGSLENLRIASGVTKLPCLRKDFIVDEIQIVEARANGADAILLIVAALSQPEMQTLGRRANEFGLDVLCEVHDAHELERALDAGYNLVGVNNRDLQTFKVDLDTAFRLAELIPEKTLRIAESGIRNGADIARLRSAGYQGFLIGESLMAAKSPGEALRNLNEQGNRKLIADSRKLVQ